MPRIESTEPSDIVGPARRGHREPVVAGRRRPAQAGTPGGREGRRRSPNPGSGTLVLASCAALGGLRYASSLDRHAIVRREPDHGSAAS